MNKDYTKIKLRDFRRNLTQLKDSGQVYEVTQRGATLAYFVPATYKMRLETKNTTNNKEFLKALEDLAKCKIEFKKPKKIIKSYKD
jgi:predicted ATP-dependent endonuclease of OLD family